MSTQGYDEVSESERLSFSFAKKFGVVLSEIDNAWVLFHKADVLPETILEVRRNLGQAFQLQLLDDEAFELKLTQVFQRDSSEARQLMQDIGNEVDFFTLAEELPTEEDLLESDDDAPIIKLINAMLSEAIKEGASDIHVETFERALVIRFRIDGVLREILKPNRQLASLLISRIKVMSKMDIAEKRIPQDGRISLRIGGRGVDVRASSCTYGC